MTYNKNEIIEILIDHMHDMGLCNDDEFQNIAGYKSFILMASIKLKRSEKETEGLGLHLLIEQDLNKF